MLPCLILIRWFKYNSFKMLFMLFKQDTAIFSYLHVSCDPYELFILVFKLFKAMPYFLISIKIEIDMLKY